MSKEIENIRISLEQLEEEEKLNEIRKAQDDQRSKRENSKNIENGKNSGIADLLPETFPKSFWDLGDLVTEVGKDILKESLSSLWGEFSKDSDSKKKKSKK